MTDLLDQCRALLGIARQRTADHPCHADIVSAEARLDEPLRVAVAGRVKAGKSTLVNAMVGELIAPTDARECTKVVTWYRDGVTYRVHGTLADGGSVPLRFDRDGGSLLIDLGGRSHDDISSIDVTWPSRRLREMTLIDTPGIGSLSEAVAARAERFLAARAEEHAPADAVIYLLRHVHTADVRFLEAFHDDRMSAANPLNSIGVLSRADEIGAARPDAMGSAERIAERWRQDPRMAALVQTVVPVAGLVAEAASTLRQHEFDSLAALAASPPALVDELLVSADRFGGADAPVGTSNEERRHLLERLGLYGSRVAVGAVRSGQARTAAALADHLLDASGLPVLRKQLAERFARRRELLKARHALAVVAHVAAVTGDRALAVEAERVGGSAHEFAELRIVNAVRRGLLADAPARQVAALRLLGEHGFALADRLGLDGGTGADDMRLALVEELTAWQRFAERPLCTPAAADAARVLARTCEGLLVGLSVTDEADLRRPAAASDAVR